MLGKVAWPWRDETKPASRTKVKPPLSKTKGKSKGKSEVAKMVWDGSMNIEYCHENPRNDGTCAFLRFEVYKQASTVTEARLAGATLKDLDCDFHQGWMRILGEGPKPVAAKVKRRSGMVRDDGGKANVALLHCKKEEPVKRHSGMVRDDGGKADDALPHYKGKEPLVPTSLPQGKLPIDGKQRCRKMMWNVGDEVEFCLQNHRKPGCLARARYELYKNAVTVGEATRKGATVADLDWGYHKQWMSVDEDPIDVAEYRLSLSMDASSSESGPRCAPIWISESGPDCVPIANAESGPCCALTQSEDSDSDS